jgi:hypothetical protein
VVVHGGAGVVAAKTRWRERKKRENCWLEENNWGGRLFFFVNFAPNFLHSLVMESTSIYKGWKRDILYLMVSNLGS